MNLKEFFAQKDNPPELFWSLILGEGSVLAGIWHVRQDGVAEVIAVSDQIEWSSDEGLLTSADNVLSSCIQKLPENFTEPQKTVFGTPTSWSSGGEIKEEYLEKIKLICKELSLTPAGFVVMSEALAHFYKQEEGVPLNSLILGFNQKEIDVSVYKLGHLEGSANVAKSTSMNDDVVEGLSRFSDISPLPSRIIVFNDGSSETETISNLLNNLPWQDNENIKFLHEPRVEIIDNERLILAVSLAGAGEMVDVKKVAIAQTDDTQQVLANDNVKLEQLANVEPLKNHNTGFVIGEDVAIKEAKNPANTVSVPNASLVKKIKMPRLPKMNFSLPKKKLSILIFLLVAVLIGLGVYWWFFFKASVLIYVSPKKSEEQFELSFDEDELKTVEVSGEKTKKATGSKKVGDKAKGTVQIRNGTASNINLTAGTFLLSAGDLRFTTESSASISAALSPSQPGVATVTVTAVDIGSEYNLAKDEIFKVSNYPKAEVDATSTANISGGTSRDITTASKDDIDGLREDLTSELAEEAKSKLKAETSENEMLIDDIVESEVVNEKFSHKVGDEAENVKLSMDLSVNAVITNKSELANIVREKLKEQIPQGFVLRDTQIDYKFDFDKEEDGNYIFDVSVGANFLPEIRDDVIRKKISGKLSAVAEKYLATIPGFVKADIRFKHTLPWIFGALPHVSKNISIEITAVK